MIADDVGSLGFIGKGASKTFYGGSEFRVGAVECCGVTVFRAYGFPCVFVLQRVCHARVPWLRGYLSSANSAQLTTM